MLSGTTAQWQVTPVTPGRLELALDFAGDAQFAPARLGRVVDIAPAFTIGLAVAGTPRAGTSLMLTATVTPLPPPGARVTFLANGTAIGSVGDSDAGRFALAHTPLSVGEIHFVARLEAGAGISPVDSGPVSVTVARQEVSLVLTAPVGPHLPGAVLPVTARIDPPTASGPVAFLLDGIEVARADLTGGMAAASLAVPAGQSRLSARYDGDARHLPARADPILLTSLTAQDILDAHADQVMQSLTASGRGAATLRRNQMDRMMGDARGRLADQRAGKPRPRPRLSWSGVTPSGTMQFVNGAGSIAGQFEGSGPLGGFMRHLSGEFALLREDGITTGQLTMTLLLERSLGDATLGGFVLGAEVGRSSITAPLSGTVDRAGLSLGVYGAHSLVGDVVLDGYLIYTRSFGNSDLASGTARIRGGFAEDGIAARLALSGRYEPGAVLIEPILSLSHLAGQVNIGQLDVIGGGLTGSGTLPNAHWALTELRLAPRVTWRLGEGQSVWIEPAASLQWERDLNTRKSDTAVSIDLGTNWRFDNGGRVDFGLARQFKGLRSGTEVMFSYEVNF